MSFERVSGPEAATPSGELFSPAVTHLRHIASMAPVAMLAAEILVALSATPTGTARSAQQLALLLVLAAVAVAIAAIRRARRIRRPEESPAMTTVELRNLTPHPVTLLDADDRPVTLTPAGPVPRVGLSRQEVDQVATAHGRIRITESSLTATVQGLPEPRDGVLLIVSRLTAEAASERFDLVFPDDLQRDLAGVVVGARALGRIRCRWPA